MSCVVEFHKDTKRMKYECKCRYYQLLDLRANVKLKGQSILMNSPIIQFHTAAHEQQKWDFISF